MLGVVAGTGTGAEPVASAVTGLELASGTAGAPGLNALMVTDAVTEVVLVSSVTVTVTVCAPVVKLNVS